MDHTNENRQFQEAMQPRMEARDSSPPTEKPVSAESPDRMRKEHRERQEEKERHEETEHAEKLLDHITHSNQPDAIDQSVDRAKRALKNTTAFEAFLHAIIDGIRKLFAPLSRRQDSERGKEEFYAELLQRADREPAKILQEWGIPDPRKNQARGTEFANVLRRMPQEAATTSSPLARLTILFEGLKEAYPSFLGIRAEAVRTVLFARMRLKEMGIALQPTNVEGDVRAAENLNRAFLKLQASSDYPTFVRNLGHRLKESGKENVTLEDCVKFLDQESIQISHR